MIYLVYEYSYIQAGVSWGVGRAFTKRQNQLSRIMPSSHTYVERKGHTRYSNSSSSSLVPFIFNLFHTRTHGNISLQRGGERKNAFTQQTIRSREERSVRTGKVSMRCRLAASPPPLNQNHVLTVQKRTNYFYENYCSKRFFMQDNSAATRGLLDGSTGNKSSTNSNSVHECEWYE